MPLALTLKFKPLNVTRSHQCLNIEIIDDSLAEYPERIGILISTNSSEVDIECSYFEILINDNDKNGNFSSPDIYCHTLILSCNSL